VFNHDNVIVWSDDPTLVGTQRTGHLDHLTQAMLGEVQAVFNPSRPATETAGPGHPLSESIECYVPVFDHNAAVPESTVIAVLSLYRDPKDLNQTIQQGLFLLWAVIGCGGLVLFLALYKLFSMVYSRQKTAESKFSKLMLEHETHRPDPEDVGHG